MRKKYLALAIALCMCAPTALVGCDKDNTSATEAAEVSKPKAKDVKKVLSAIEEDFDADAAEITITDNKLNEDGDKCTTTGTFIYEGKTYDFEIPFTLDDETQKWTCKKPEEKAKISIHQGGSDVETKEDPGNDPDKPTEDPDKPASNTTAVEDTFKPVEDSVLVDLLRKSDGKLNVDFWGDVYIPNSELADIITVDSTEFDSYSARMMFSGTYKYDIKTYNFKGIAEYNCDWDNGGWKYSYVSTDGEIETQIHIEGIDMDTVKELFSKSWKDITLSEHYDDKYGLVDFSTMTVTELGEQEVEENVVTAPVTVTFTTERYGDGKAVLSVKFIYDTSWSYWTLDSYELISLEVGGDVAGSEKETTTEEEETTTEEEMTTAEEETTTAEEETTKEGSSDIDAEAAMDLLEEWFCAEDYEVDENTVTSLFKLYPQVAFVYCNDDDIPELMAFDGEEEGAFVFVTSDGKVRGSAIDGENFAVGDKDGKLAGIFVTVDGDVTWFDYYMYNFDGDNLYWGVDPYAKCEKDKDGKDVYTYYWPEGEIDEDGDFINAKDDSGDYIYNEVSAEEYVKLYSENMDIEADQLTFYDSFDDARKALK